MTNGKARPIFDTPDLTFNPGPSEYMPGVREYMAEGLELGRLSHRSEEFQRTVEFTGRALRQLLDIPEDYTIAYLGSATEAMGLTIKNLVPNASQHFVNGAFSERFYLDAQAVGIIAHKEEVPMGKGFDLANIMEGLSSKGTDILCVTHNETSTGVQLDTSDIAELANNNLKRLLAVDITSSVPYVDLDYSEADVAFFSVQKGFGMPPGLGVVAVSPEAIEISEVLTRDGFDTGGSKSFANLHKFAEKHQTPETPNMAHIYTLGRVATDMYTWGMSAIRRETEEKAKLLYDYFEQRDGVRLFVRDEKFRSQTVIVIEGDEVSLLRQGLREQFNIEVGSGYGPFKDKHIRIGNFPAHRMEDLEQLITAIEEID